MAGPDQGMDFSLMCKSSLWQILVGSVAKKPCSELWMESGRKSLAGGASASVTASKTKGNHGGQHS